MQTVQYSTNWVYVTTNGIPAYPTGPFLDGNPSLAYDQNAIFKFPLNPTQNTGTLTATNGGNIGDDENEDDINNDLTGVAKSASFLSGLIRPILEFITNIGYVAVVFVGGILAGAANSINFNFYPQHLL